MRVTYVSAMALWLMVAAGDKMGMLTMDMMEMDTRKLDDEDVYLEVKAERKLPPLPLIYQMSPPALFNMPSQGVLPPAATYVAVTSTGRQLPLETSASYSYSSAVSAYPLPLWYQDLLAKYGITLPANLSKADNPPRPAQPGAFYVGSLPGTYVYQVGPTSAHVWLNATAQPGSSGATPNASAAAGRRFRPPLQVPRPVNPLWWTQHDVIAEELRGFVIADSDVPVLLPPSAFSMDAASSGPAYYHAVSWPHQYGPPGYQLGSGPAQYGPLGYQLGSGPAQYGLPGYQGDSGPAQYGPPGYQLASGPAQYGPPGYQLGSGPAQYGLPGYQLASGQPMYNAAAAHSQYYGPLPSQTIDVTAPPAFINTNNPRLFVPSSPTPQPSGSFFNMNVVHW